MISAKQAREMTSTLCKEAQRNLEDIEQEIKCHAAKGEHCFWHDGYVHRQAQNVLVKLGYEIKESFSQIDGETLQIKW